MKLSRPNRVVAALVALFSVLFTQLAVAAYACPSVQLEQAIATANMATAALDEHHGMPGCEEADVEQLALCHTHTQAADQSLDRPAEPNLSPALALVLIPAVGEIGRAYRPVIIRTVAPQLARQSEPNLAIRNCCFRI